jgi:hypothetical protein
MNGIAPFWYSDREVTTKVRGLTREAQDLLLTALAAEPADLDGALYDAERKIREARDLLNPVPAHVAALLDLPSLRDLTQEPTERYRRFGGSLATLPREDVSVLLTDHATR